jgi:pyruvate, water dikinase
VRRLVLLALVAACGEPVDATPDSGVAPDTGVPPIDDRYLTHIESFAELYGLDTEAREGVKFLAPVSTATRTAPLTEDCYFQNSNLFQWHLQFLQSFEELKRIDYNTYLNWVLRPASRRLWGGYVKAYPSVEHPDTGALGIIAFEVYSDPNTLTVDGVAELDQIVKRTIPFAADFIVFVPRPIDQKVFAQANLAALRDRQVSVIFPEQLMIPGEFAVYNPGEGYGTLRIVLEGQRLDDYGPRDIVIVESAPNDISVVQGLITRDPQNALSHTNLRLIEKGVPNVAVPSIYRTPYVAALKDTLVRLVVNAQTFSLEPATLEAAEAFWASRRPHLPPIRSDLTVTEMGGYDRIRHADAIAYGAKAANIGELYSILPEANRTPGFGIPFSRYDAFVRDTGIQTMIETAIADPRMRTDAAFKRTQLKAIRDAIKAAPFPPALLDDLEASMLAVFGAGAPTMRTKFRSSTNVEDLDDLTGAGLYESKAGCLADDRDSDLVGPSACLFPDLQADYEAKLAARTQELTDHPERAPYLVGIIEDLQAELGEEKTASLAIKKVWASLWGERAFDEREYYGIDHLEAYMAIGVNQSFVLERASAVAITQLMVDSGDPLYRLNSQIGSSSVVRPDDPTEIAEALTFRRSNEQVADVQIEVRSTLLPADQQVWTQEALAEVAQALFTLHDHFSANVYPQLAPLSMDVELKWARDGRVVIKQARPFVSFGP